jgi:hypothetical protein
MIGCRVLPRMFHCKLVGHLSRLLPLFDTRPRAAKWTTTVGGTATKSVASIARSIPSPFALASPHKGRGISVPALSRFLQPLDNLLWSPGMLSVQGAPHQDALNRLAHSEPRTAKWRVERHDAVLTQPPHETGCVVSAQVIQHQQQTQGRHLTPDTRGQL